MTAGWGPRRAGVRRGVTDPAAVVPGHISVPAVGYGTCGHPIIVHDIRKSGTRGACSHMGPEGQCPCRGCEPAEAGQ